MLCAFMAVTDDARVVPNLIARRVGKMENDPVLTGFAKHRPTILHLIDKGKIVPKIIIQGLSFS